MPKPILFISAVSKELRSARQLVANTLTFLGYESEWQEIFGTGDGDLRDMLRRRIDASKGVVQLVGRAFGAEVPGGDASLGRISFTQFEAIYARSQGKPVWYLTVDEGFPTDPFDPEPDDVCALQARYRETVKADAHLHHSLRTQDALKVAVHELRNDLARVRLGARRWAILAVIVLLVGAVLGGWLVLRQEHTSEQLADAVEAITAMRSELARFQEGASGQFRAKSSGRTHAVPVDLTPEFDREQAEIEAEGARLARAIAVMNVATMELNTRMAELDSSDEVAVRAHNAQVSSSLAARAELESWVNQYNLRVDTFNSKMAAADTEER